MAKPRPVPDDPEFDKLVAELAALARKVRRAEDRLASLIEERDRMVVELLGRFEPPQGHLAQRTGLTRENIARIVACSRRPAQSTSTSTTDGGPQ